jgi:hypothetical protein
MKKLLDKELELIKPPLKNHISSALENNYETNKGETISKVLGIHISDIDVDAFSSNFREQILVNELKMKARVKVKNTSKKESTIKLTLNEDILLSYHKNTKQYKVINTGKMNLISLVTK